MRLSRVLWMAAALALCPGCSKVPRKPASVPAEAFWVGPKAQGAFVQVGSKELFGWNLKVYDRNGALLKEGFFRLEGFARAELVPDELVGWDGKAVLLADGGRLVAKP